MFSLFKCDFKFENKPSTKVMLLLKLLLLFLPFKIEFGSLSIAIILQDNFFKIALLWLV